MKTFELKLVTRIQDNQDGGFTTFMYNNEDELIEDHPRNEDGLVKITDKLRRQILEEDNPYDNGYIGSATIKLHVHPDGKITLAAPIICSGGQ